MKDQESFKPYIPAEKITAEMTATSVIMGIILSVVFGAANAYLGLRVGMTVSASIPAAAAAGLMFVWSIPHAPVRPLIPFASRHWR